MFACPIITVNKLRKKEKNYLPDKKAQNINMKAFKCTGVFILNMHVTI